MKQGAGTEVAAEGSHSEPQTEAQEVYWNPKALFRGHTSSSNVTLPNPPRHSPTGDHHDWDPWETTPFKSPQVLGFSETIYVKVSFNINYLVFWNMFTHCCALFVLYGDWKFEVKLICYLPLLIRPLVTSSTALISKFSTTFWVSFRHLVYSYIWTRISPKIA